jgi:hypothetical protein
MTDCRGIRSPWHGATADADRFLPAVGLMRIRELVARYSDFKAEPDFGVFEGITRGV